MAGEKAVDDGALDDVFASGRDRGTDSAVPEQEPVGSQSETPEPEARARAPDPEAKADDDGSPKQYRDPETGRFVPLTELRTERQKRQEEARLRGDAERRAAAAEAALQEARRYWDQAQRPQHQQQHQQPQMPDPVLEPQAWAAHVQGQMRAEYEQRDFQNRVATSQALMRARYPDYDEVEAMFVQAAQHDPGLAHRMAASPMPAKFAYEAGKAIAAVMKVGVDPDAFEKRVRDEERQKVLAELKAGPAQRQHFPGTLADAPASGAQGRVLSDAAMLSDVFRSDRRYRSG